MQIKTLMKIQNFRASYFSILLGLSLIALGLAGCATPDYKAEMEAPTGATSLVALPPLVVGDTVTITLSGLPSGEMAYEKPINQDGSITLPDIGRVQAAGKTPGELEDYVHGLYVPAIYTHLTVTVKTTSDRVYFVRGEVKSPGRLIYVGPITVTKAITSAGDFTDFANRHKVFLTRSNNKRFRLDCDKILAGEAPDPPVYPGDQIEVKKRVW